MIDFIKSLLFLTFVGFTESGKVKITRGAKGIKDATYGYEQCAWFDRTTGPNFKCYCKEDFTTMISDTNTPYDCVQPKEIGCKYNLANNLQAYLVTASEAAEKLIGETSDATAQLIRDITSNELSIKNITMWNYENKVGRFENITTEASPYFGLHTDSQSLQIKDLNLAVWGGHALRIYFSDENCLALKVKGDQTYPYDVEIFRSLFHQLPVRTTASARHTDAPPHPRVKTTREPEIARILGNSTSSSTIIMAVIIAVLFLGNIVLVYQRRKMTKSYSSQNDFEGNTSTSKYPSVMNNAYAPDDAYRNDVFIAPPETPPAIASGNAASNNEGHVGHVAENPIYKCYVESSSSSGDDVSRKEPSTEYHE